MFELRMVKKHPLDALKETRIGGDAVFNGNGLDEYEIEVVWSEIEDGNTTGGFKKLKEATIKIQLRGGA